MLGLFFSRLDEAFYVREVARRTGGALGAVQRELGVLVQAGILTRVVRGRQVYYQANRQCPVFEELRAIVAKTSGLVDVADWRFNIAYNAALQSAKAALAAGGYRTARGSRASRDSSRRQACRVCTNRTSSTFMRAQELR